jgi:hypothetical protein
MIITETIIQHNTAQDRGGALSISSPKLITTIARSTISDNFAWTDGGGIWIDGGLHVQINQTQMGDNQARDGNGGGIAAKPPTSSSFGIWLVLQDCNIDGNVAHTNGGALSLEESVRFDAFDSSFNGNKAQNGDGGAVYIAKSGGMISKVGLQLTRTTFDTNEAMSGGALRFSEVPTVNISDTIFINNYARNFGGGLMAAGIWQGVGDRCRFITNRADVGGGAIYWQSAWPMVSDPVHYDFNSLIPSWYKNGNTTFNGNAALLFGPNMATTPVWLEAFYTGYQLGSITPNGSVVMVTMDSTQQSDRSISIVVRDLLSQLIDLYAVKMASVSLNTTNVQRLILTGEQAAVSLGVANFSAFTVTGAPNSGPYNVDVHVTMHQDSGDVEITTSYSKSLMINSCPPGTMIDQHTHLSCDQCPPMHFSSGNCLSLYDSSPSFRLMICVWGFLCQVLINYHVNYVLMEQHVRMVDGLITLIFGSMRILPIIHHHQHHHYPLDHVLLVYVVGIALVKLVANHMIITLFGTPSYSPLLLLSLMLILGLLIVVNVKMGIPKLYGHQHAYHATQLIGEWWLQV